MHNSFNLYGDNVTVCVKHIKLFGQGRAYILAWIYRYCAMRASYLINQNRYDADEPVWFFKDQAEFASEAGVSIRTITSAISFFKKHNIVLATRKKKIWWYSLDLTQLERYMCKTSTTESSQKKSLKLVKNETKQSVDCVEFELDPDRSRELLYLGERYNENAQFAFSDSSQGRVCVLTAKTPFNIHNNVINNNMFQIENNLYKWVVRALERVTGQTLNHGGKVTLDDQKLGRLWQNLSGHATRTSIENNPCQKLIRSCSASERALIVPKFVHEWVFKIIERHDDIKQLSFSTGEITDFDTMPSLKDLLEKHMRPFNKGFKRGSTMMNKTRKHELEPYDDDNTLQQKLFAKLNQTTGAKRIAQQNRASNAAAIVSALRNRE